MARIDLVDLELLAAVAELGSFTRGAERMHISLASASERIRLLEQRLGLRLFERRPRGVAATAAGRRVLGHAHGILERVAALRAEVPQLRDGAQARLRLRLWSNTAALAEWVPARLAAFLRDRPQVDVELAEHGSADIVAALRRGHCDIGVVSDAADSAGLHCLPVRADPLALVVPRAHPGVAGGRPSLQALAGEAWVGLAADAPLQRWIEGHARADGCRLSYRLRVGTLDEVCRMVGEGVGLAVVPRATAVRRRRDGFRRIALQEPWTRRGLQVCVLDRDALPAPGVELAERLAAATPRG